MSHLPDDYSILEADPAQIRGQASELARVARAMDDVARRLRQVSVDGIWESQSGRTFAARVGDTPDGLEDIADRLADAAEAMRPYATRLEKSQRQMTSADEDAAAAQRRKDAKDRELESMSADDPGRAQVMRERGDAVADLLAAERDFTREGTQAHHDEGRVAARLHNSGSDLDDPSGYDWLEGIEGLGRTAGNVGIVAKPVALGGVGEPLGKAGRRLFYDEGSWNGVAMSGAGYGLDIATFGIGRAAKAIRNKAVNNAAGRVPGLRSKPLRVKDNPIAMRDRVVAAARDRSGMTDAHNFMDDWSNYAGAGNVAKVSIGVEHSVKLGNRLTGTIGDGVTVVRSSGIDSRARAREEQEEKRRRRTIERVRQ